MTSPIPERQTPWRWWLVATVVLAAVVLYVAASPTNPSIYGRSLRNEGWVGHLIAGCSVGAMIGITFSIGPARFGRWAVGAVAVFLLAAELAQTQFPARTASVADAVSGLAGLLGCWMLSSYWFRTTRSRNQQFVAATFTIVATIAAFLAAGGSVEADLRPELAGLEPDDPIVVVGDVGDERGDGALGSLAETTVDGGSVLTGLTAGSFDRSVPDGTELLPNSRAWHTGLPDVCVSSTRSPATGTDVSQTGFRWSWGLDRRGEINVASEPVGGPTLRGELAPEGSPLFDPAHALALFADARELSKEIRASGQFTLAARFSPDALGVGPARLVGLSGGVNPIAQNVQLGLDGESLMFRLATACRLITWVDTDIIVPMGQPSTALVTFDGSIASVYLDGVLMSSYQFTDASLDLWFDALPLVVGNEATLDRTFEGDITAVAVLSESLSPAGAVLLSEELGR